MQAKGLIKFFVITTILICIYQLSFTVVGYLEDKKADNYAIEKVEALSDSLTVAEKKQEQASQKRRYLDSIKNEVVYDIFVDEYTYADVIKRRINLGLDLQGGMSVVLEVSLKELVIAMADGSKDEAFIKALDDAAEAQKQSEEDLITLFALEVAKNENLFLADLFATPNNKEIIEPGDDNAKVIEAIRKEGDDAVDRTFKIIRTRIDQFGVANPNVSKVGSNRIIVELPGIDDPERARKLLQATAKLEFWPTWENAEIGGYLFNAEAVVRNLLGLNDTATVDTNLIDSTENLASDALDTELSDESTQLTDDDTSENTLFDDDNQLFADDDTTGLADSTVNNNTFINKLLYLYIIEDNWAKGPVVGFSLPEDRKQVNEYLAMDEVRSLFPSNIKFLWGAKANANGYYELYAIKTNPYEDKAPLEGDVIIDSRQDIDGSDGTPNVDMTMNQQGAKIWEKMTEEAAPVNEQELGRSIAIVLDNTVYSAPGVRGKISGGRSQISGNFTIEEAQDLANTIKAGKLPAPAKIVEEEIVGPTLGAESVSAGLKSLLLGLGLVLLFMIVYYQGGGVVANIVLALNLFYIMGVLASYAASLTLPGIAGIVLTIGMAVDANVIIFERIREELSRGKGMRLAIADGYSNSYTAIIDANLTTLITGFILLFFGLGPVKGFAMVLVIGIMSSFVTAVLVSRILIEGYMATGDREISFASKMTSGMFKNLGINFLDKRIFSYSISTIIVGLGLISIFAVKGFELGVDFKGGRSYRVLFDQEIVTSKVAKSLSEVFEGNTPEVKTIGTANNELKITTAYKIDDNSDGIDAEVEEKLFEGLKPYLPEGLTLDQFQDVHKQSSMKVSPTIADDIRSGAWLAALLAFTGIFLYILVRFRKWQFGLGALVAVLHDAIILMAVFSVFHGILPFSMEINQAFIAALLTVIGYSLNDTVIVFDRVREYMGLHPTKDLKTVTNMAINSTLSRTIITSLTTLLVVLSLTIFGGDTIRGFSFALLIGVLVGTYSSVFIATPIVVDLLGKEKKK